jgi:hypothetical protein
MGLEVTSCIAAAPGCYLGRHEQVPHRRKRQGIAQQKRLHLVHIPSLNCAANYVVDVCRLEPSVRFCCRVEEHPPGEKAMHDFEGVLSYSLDRPRKRSSQRSQAPPQPGDSSTKASVKRVLDAAPGPHATGKKPSKAARLGSTHGKASAATNAKSPRCGSAEREEAHEEQRGVDKNGEEGAQVEGEVIVGVTATPVPPRMLDPNVAGSYSDDETPAPFTVTRTAPASSTTHPAAVLDARFSPTPVPMTMGAITATARKLSRFGSGSAQRGGTALAAGPASEDDASKPTHFKMPQAPRTIFRIDAKASAPVAVVAAQPTAAPPAAALVECDAGAGQEGAQEESRRRSTTSAETAALEAIALLVEAPLFPAEQAATSGTDGDGPPALRAACGERSCGRQARADMGLLVALMEELLVGWMPEQACRSVRGHRYL